MDLPKENSGKTAIIYDAKLHKITIIGNYDKASFNFDTGNKKDNLLLKHE